MGVRPVGVSIGSIAKFFPQKQIEEILRASGREGQRRRKLPSMDLMYYLVALGLHASEGCRSVLRKVLLRKGSIEDEQLDRISSDSAISQARSRLGWEPLRALYLAVVQPIATRASVGVILRSLACAFGMTARGVARSRRRAGSRVDEPGPALRFSLSMV